MKNSVDPISTDEASWSGSTQFYIKKYDSQRHFTLIVVNM